MNARYRQYNPEETYFTIIDPKDIRNHNPLLKAIDSFIEEHISVEPFSHSVKNEVEGAPAVHPTMILKINGTKTLLILTNGLTPNSIGRELTTYFILFDIFDDLQSILDSN